MNPTGQTIPEPEVEEPHAETDGALFWFSTTLEHHGGNQQPV